MYKGVGTDPRGHTSLPDAQLTRIIIYPAADTVMKDNKSRMRYATSFISTLAKPLTLQSANQLCVTKSHLIIIPHATKVSCRRLHLFAPKTMLPRSANPRYFFQIQYVKLARQVQALLYFIAGRNSSKGKRRAIRRLPSARFEQRCSSLDIWRCFRRARRVIMPPSCNNQQRHPANTTPHLLPCSEATLDCRSRGRLQLTAQTTQTRRAYKTLHLPEPTQAALASLGAAVHHSTHTVKLSLEKRCIAFSPQRATTSAPRACHRVDQDILACATMCNHSSVCPPDRPVEFSLRMLY
jgi:hypothetical protein